MKNKIAIFIFIICAITACKKNTQKPGRAFMPDMAYSKASEPYSPSTIFSDSMSARVPVEGTIPRGFMPYHYPNTKEGYELAGENLKNPVVLTDEVMAEGKRLYSIYCIVCHGESGMGDGSIVTIPKDGFPPPPAYSSALLKILPEGKMFHSVTFGKLNTMMPSYASQLTKEQRWNVIHYVQTLQTLDMEDVGDEDNNEDQEEMENPPDVQ